MKASPAILEHERRRSLACDFRRPFGACGLAAAPVRASLGNELVCPVDVNGRLHGADGGNRTSAFGDHQSSPGSNALQVTAQMRLELANTDRLHSTPHQVTTMLTLCSHMSSPGAGKTAARPVERSVTDSRQIRARQVGLARR